MPNYPFVKDDGGRSKSSRPKQNKDCAVVAVAIASGYPYEQVYEDFAQDGRRCSTATHDRIWWNWCVDHFSMEVIKMPRPVRGSTRTKLKDFCERYDVGCFIISVRKHLVAVVDGIVRGDYPPDDLCSVYKAVKLIRGGEA